MKLVFRFLLAGCAVLFLSNGKKNTEPGPDTTLVRELGEHRHSGHLEEWIYALLNWAEKDYAARASVLHELSGKSWRPASTPEEIQAWLDLLVNKGYAWLLAGDIVASTEAYTQAYEYARLHQDQADEALVMEHILKPLGNNYTRLGDYEQAMYIHQKSLVLASLLQDKEAQAGIYSNMANTAAGMGDPETAIDHCRQGLQLAGSHPALQGLLYSELADAFLRTGRPDSARSAILESISLLTPEQHDRYAAYWLLMAYQVAGDVFGDQQEQAHTWYRKAWSLQQILSHGENIRQRERAKLFHRLAAWAARWGHREEALAWSDSCLALLCPGKSFSTLGTEDLYGENTLIDLLFTRAGISGDRTLALHLYTMCFEAEKKLTLEYVSPAARERAVAGSRDRHEAAIAWAYDTWNNGRNPRDASPLLLFMEYSKARLLKEELEWNNALRRTGADSLAARSRLIEKAIAFYSREMTELPDGSARAQSMAERKKQLEWERAGLKKQLLKEHTTKENPPFTLQDLQKLPDTSWRLRSWFAGREALYVAESGRSGIRFLEKIPMPAGWKDSLSAFTRKYFATGAAAMMNAPGSYYTESHAIWQSVSGQHPMEENASYILLPDAALSRLPIEALVTAPSYTSQVGQWPFVVKSISISYAYSIQTLLSQLEGSPNTSGMAGFFLTTNGRDQPRLEAVENERKQLTKLVGNGDWFVNSKASYARFRDALGKNAVVHVSTHAGAGHEPRLELYDAPYYLSETGYLDKHPALLVMNACRTGDGRLLEGEGVQSLARAFTAAGVNGVVSGWWNVNDAAAPAMMSDFYRNIIKGESPAGALRSAKLEWLAGKGREDAYKLPYYWAALHYQGNPAPPIPAQALKKKGSFFWWVLALGTLLFITNIERKKTPAVATK